MLWVISIICFICSVILHSTVAYISSALWLPRHQRPGKLKLLNTNTASNRMFLLAILFDLAIFIILTYCKWYYGFLALCVAFIIARKISSALISNRLKDKAVTVVSLMAADKLPKDLFTTDTNFIGHMSNNADYRMRRDLSIRLNHFLSDEKEINATINLLLPAEIVQSIASIWVRVPVCICFGYYEYKDTGKGAIDYEAIMKAIAETEIQVYGRDAENVKEEEAYKLAIRLYHKLKTGSEQKKIKDAVRVLLIAELIKGGTSISVNLAKEAAELGYIEISKPLLEIIVDVAEAGYTPEANVCTDAIDEAVAKAMSFTDYYYKHKDQDV